MDPPPPFDPRPLVFEMGIGTPPEVVKYLGEYSVDLVTDQSIEFNASAGDLRDPVLYDNQVDNFHFDGLYRASSGGESWYFRFGDHAFSGGTTQFTFLNWANNNRPAAGGPMEFSVVRKDIPQTGSIELSTVGDSITWAGRGESLRKRLAIRNPDIRFVGSHTDTYGYRHEGEGGDDTRKVLARMGRIVPSENYLLLIGTNDRFPEEETVKNINLIVSGLLQKKAWNRVYLMTILPRNDSYDERNIRVNQKIRDWVAQTGSDRIRLIDAEIGFRNLPNWRELLPDGLHPSDEGYWQLIEIIFRGGQ